MFYNWKNSINEIELNDVANSIKNGEIVVMPTETVYGVGADLFNEEAIKKIFIAKNRPATNPLIVHIGNKNEIDIVAQKPNEIEQALIDAFMPGPFTIILKKKDCIPDIVSAGLDTIGVRMPSNEIANRIITKVGNPIVLPSANISGRPSGTRVEDIFEELESKVYAIVDGGESPIGLESTVVKVVDDVPVILRPGKITLEDIVKVVGKCELDKNIFQKPAEVVDAQMPGSKLEHYVSKLECNLICGQNNDKIIDKIKEIIQQRNGKVAIIAFEDIIEKIDISKDRLFPISRTDNLEKDELEYAEKLYRYIREAENTDSDLILIQGVKEEGLGVAIMNRLLRTSSFRIINID